MSRLTGSLAALALAGLMGCADGDNPTALADLQTETEFELTTTRVETFEEIEIHVHVEESGTSLGLHEAELEIEHALTGASRVVPVEPEGHGYAAHVTFFAPGEHHLHLEARPEGHNLMHEMGETELEVHRHHRVIGPYWVEIEVSPAPVLEGQTGHIHFLVFDLLEDGTPGNAAGGLDLGLEVHDPAGTGTSVGLLEEEVGEYEAEYGFGEAGAYEMHLEIDLGAEHADGEFHVPVLSSVEDEPDDHEDDGGDGHEHTH